MKTGDLLLAVGALTYAAIKVAEKSRPQGVSSGGGPEPIRYGCTDPFAANWDPQALAYGETGVTQDFWDSFNNQVCEYYNDPSFLDVQVGEQVRTGYDWIYAPSNRKDVCWSPEDPKSVLIRAAEVSHDDQFSNLTPCPAGSYLVGVIDSAAVLRAPEGTFEDGPFSASSAFGESLKKPQDGDIYDGMAFFEYLVEQHDPVGDSFSTLATTPLTSQSFQLYYLYNNLAVMKERFGSMSSGRMRFYEPIYGTPWKIGSADTRNFADFDLDKNGVISTLFGMTATETEGPQLLSWPGLENEYENWGSPVLRNIDVNNDNFVSIFEILMYTGHVMGYAISQVAPWMAGSRFFRAWSEEDFGYLGYNGITCSDTEIYSDEDAENLCFNFRKKDIEYLEGLKEGYDDANLAWNVVDPADSILLRDFYLCFRQNLNARECRRALGDKNYDRALGYHFNSNMQYYQNEETSASNELSPLDAEGTNNVSGTSFMNRYFDDVPKTPLTENSQGTPIGPYRYQEFFNTAGDFSSNPPSMPSDYINAWDGQARLSCPASHPYFVRFCQSDFTLEEGLGGEIPLRTNNEV